MPDSVSETLNSSEKDREERSCLNCGCRLKHSFCPSCGQASSTERYAFDTIFSEVYNHFRSIDLTTTFRTFVELIRRPGDFIRNYLNGQRVGYLNPVKFFFYSFVVSILVGGWVFWLTNDKEFQSLSKLDLRLEIAALISTVFWGLLWKLFYRKSGLNLAENIIVGLFLVGQTNFLSLLVSLILILLPFWKGEAALRASISDIAGIVIALGYSTILAKQLFREQLYLLIPKQVILSLLYFVLIIIVFTLSVLVSFM